MIAQRAVVAGFVGLLGGCAFEPVLTSKAVDYNRVFEDSNNSVMLLNVLRAKDRKPLYFTHVQNLNPTIGSSYGLNLTIPLNPTQYTTLSLNPSGRVDSSSTGQVATEASQKFMQGITSPVKMQVVARYWDQGLAREFLLHMLIAKIEIVPLNRARTPEAEKTRVYLNAPGPRLKGDPPCRFDEYALATIAVPRQSPWCEFLAFQQAIRSIRFKMRVGVLATPSLQGPTLSSAIARDLKGVLEALKSGYTFKPEKGGYRLESTEKEYVFCLDVTRPGPEPSSAFKCADPVKGVSPDTLTHKCRDGDHSCLAVCREGICRYCPEKTGCAVNFHVRSVQQMILYLGEVARTELESGGREVVVVRSPLIGPDGERKVEVPLFRVIEGAPGGANAHVSVRYEGSVYSIPKGLTRSMHALQFVNELLGLHREASELPRTTIVNVVGP